MLADGIFSLLNTGFNYLSNSAAASQQFDYDTQAAAQQHAYNVDFWNMQNAYNDPSNQMQRLKDAGLNPYMVAGHQSPGLASTPTPPTVPARQAIAAKYDISSSLKDALNFYNAQRLTSANIDKLIQDINTGKAQESLIKERALHEATKNAISEFKRLYNDRQFREIYNNDSYWKEEKKRVLQDQLTPYYLNRLRRKEWDLKNTENQLRQSDLNLRKIGIYPTDNFIFRILRQSGRSVFDFLLDKPDEPSLRKRAKHTIDNIFGTSFAE